jgi:deoxycytidylate deaminase
MTCGIPCADCARNIINSGISQIICRSGGGAKGKKWDESAKRSLIMFQEAGVKVTFFD